ncbi:required for respiratory growth protein 9, mitochondrial [Bimuria novae-zelandiae CBS 107.79]|uniref:Required for respiratory growth protein 9, mitochondrial n=1 Tax=Bimuria novae-zelandiae CBS 107.79 TaxID=1447943 RepID=A0A6A5VKA8_9PLEO|nr:required for respiratory growth protein 9, mitochondrial [Bimuria novae-zelandiae CBS 107.79]
MNCNACSRRTLGLFARLFSETQSITFYASNRTRHTAPSRYLSAAHRPWSHTDIAENVKPFRTNQSRAADIEEEKKERPAWLVEKEATKRKLNGEAWNPRKKLSPDTMEGIRHLHKSQPERFTTPVLAQYFKVSPEAIKRILKSKWRPSDEEHEERLRRWDKRGEQIWSTLVELGVKPPKKWREMGVGRATNGEKPKWKSRSRNQVAVQDSVSVGVGVGVGDLIPIVDGKSAASSSRTANIPLSNRIGV